MLIYYYSTTAFSVPYKLVSGFGVMLLAAGFYYLKPTVINFGLSDLAASTLLLIAGLLSISLVTYKTLVLSREP
jgi:hypothetical protein